MSSTRGGDEGKNCRGHFNDDSKKMTWPANGGTQNLRTLSLLWFRNFTKINNYSRLIHYVFSYLVNL